MLLVCTYDRREDLNVLKKYARHKSYVVLHALLENYFHVNHEFNGLIYGRMLVSPGY